MPGLQPGGGNGRDLETFESKIEQNKEKIL
jgi:hypothetical protein